MKRRWGGSLAELMLVSWLFALVLLALARFASAQGRLAAGVSDRVRLEELLRATRVVLGRETRYLAPADSRAVGPDSLRLRAVRGSGSACAWGSRHVVVRYRGVRRPDPTKDSVLLVDGRDPVGTAYGVTAVASDSVCPGGIRLDLDRDLDPAFSGAASLVFESGTYHLAGGALRYRLGHGGRQPLTESVLDRGRVMPLTAAGWGPFGITLSLRPDSLPRLVSRVYTFTIAPAPRSGRQTPGTVP